MGAKVQKARRSNRGCAHRTKVGPVSVLRPTNQRTPFRPLSRQTRPTSARGRRADAQVREGRGRAPRRCPDRGCVFGCAFGSFFAVFSLFFSFFVYLSSLRSLTSCPSCRALRAARALCGLLCARACADMDGAGGGRPKRRRVADGATISAGAAAAQAAAGEDGGGPRDDPGAGDGHGDVWTESASAFAFVLPGFSKVGGQEEKTRARESRSPEKVAAVREQSKAASKRYRTVANTSFVLLLRGSQRMRLGT